MRQLFILLLSTSFGCASGELVAARGRSPHGPSNERLGGDVRYALDTNNPIGERESAYQLMHAYCQGGPYVITREWTDDGRGSLYPGAMASPASVVPGTHGQRYISFECRAASSNAPSYSGGSASAAYPATGSW